MNEPAAWWSYLLLLLPTLIMVFIGMVQVFKLFSVIRLSDGKKIGSLLGLSLLSSLAVYIGRFDRIHSIELLIHPLSVLRSLVAEWSWAKVQFILMFSILQLGIWGLLHFLRQDAKEE